MKKRFLRVLSSLLVVVMIVGSAPLSGFVGLDLPNWADLFTLKADAATDGYYTYTVLSGKAYITDVSTSISGSVTIPATLGGYTVRSIDYQAFRDCKRLTSVTIPDSVTNIGDEAFCYCTRLTSVTIPDSVTSIGDDTFYNCKSLTSITIPDSVTSIGDYAFCWCESLTSVTIPDSVTSIGKGAFYYCAGIKSVTIPDSVKSIGDEAFRYCYSLTSITVDSNNGCYSSDSYGVLYNKDKTRLIQYPIGNSRTSFKIPESVTSIGKYAFYECTSLTSVTISDSVTSIGDYAFEDCTSLKSVTIGDSVTSIGEWAFDSCTSLKSVTIGDSVTSIGEGAFGYCTSLKDVYYTGTQEQWNKIRIDYGNIDLTNATIHYEYSFVPEIKTNEYAVLVYDVKGNPVSGAKVTWNSSSDTTDKNGMVVFSRFTVGEPLITVEKTGYITYTNENINYSKSENGYEYITLYEDTSGNKLKLKSAKYSSFDINSVVGDLLHTTKTISLKKGFKFSIKCVANDADSAVKYKLYQNKNLIAESADGVFGNLYASDFKKGGGIKVRVEDSSKNYAETPLNLIFDEDKANENLSIKLGDNIQIAVPDEVPIFGGTTFKCNFPLFPVDISADVDEEGETKVSVGINYEFPEAKKDVDGNWTKEEQKSFKEKRANSIKKVKKAISTMESWYLRSTNPNDKQLKEIKNLCKDVSKAEVPGLNKVNVTLLGYGEGVYNPDKGFSSVKIKAYLMVEATAIDYSHQFAMPIGPIIVPIVVNVKVKGEGKAGFDISYELDTRTFSGDVKLNVGANVNVFGGVGIGKAVGVGGYGEAKLESEIQLIGTTNTPGLNSVDLSGELGVKAYFAIWEAQKVLINKTWNIYTRNKKPKTSNLQSPSMITDEDTIYDLQAYSLQDLSYLEEESVWLGARKGNTPSGSAGVSTSKIVPMLTNTYRDSRPMIASAGDTMVMVYVGSDTSRSVYNHARVMYSVYNKRTNTWAEPKQLDNNNTLDVTPYLYSDGTNIYVVYSDATKQFSEADDFETIITSQNISVSKFNSETGSFDTPTVLVNADGNYNSVPIIGTVNGVPTVIYQSNASNEVFGTTQDNLIIKVDLNGNKEIVASNLNSIVGYAVGNKGIAYITDSDNVLSTFDDRELYLNGSLIESGIVSNPQFANNGKLYWYSYGTVKEYDNGINEIYPDGIAGFNDNFKVLDNRIVYLTTTDSNVSNIMQLTFEDGAWSNPVMLTDQNKIIDTFSVTEYGDRTISVMTRRDVTFTENDIVDECEIAWTEITDRYDIRVDYVNYDHDAVKPNSDLTITAGITNNGTSEIKNLNVVVTNSSGEIVYSQNQNVSIKPAQEFELTAIVPIGENVNYDTYTVKVTEVDAEDSNESDNSYETVIGYANFYVNCEAFINGSYRSAMVSVRNDGYTSCGGKLYIYNSIDSENPVATYDVDELLNGEQKLYKVDITEEILGGKAGKIYAVFEPEVEQFNIFNNESETYIELEGYSTTYTVTWIVDGVEETEIYEDGAEIIKPADPTKTGYTFVGWSPEVPATMPAENLTFTAQWKADVIPSDEATLSGIIETFDNGVDNDDTTTIELFAENSDTPVYTTTVEGTGEVEYSVNSVATGTYTVKVSKQNHATREYTIEVGTEDATLDMKLHLLGDIDGDGKVKMSDLSRINAHIKETKILDGYAVACADVNCDGEIRMNDLSRVNAHIKETKPLW